MVRGFGSRLRANAIAALPGLGQIVGAAAIGTLARRAASAFKEQFDQLGEVSDAAVNLGIGTNELQGIRFGAEQAGVSADQLDTAMTKMSDTIAEAADGNKAAIETMDRLGLSAEKLSGMGTGEQMRQVADAISKIGNQSQRIRTARDVFGKSGAQLLSFFRDGAKGIDATTKRFRDLGGTLTDFDVAAADVAGDALDEVSVAFNNLGNQLAVNAAPGVTLFANALAETAGAAANGVRSQFALAQAYLEANKAAGNFIEKWLVNPALRRFQEDDVERGGPLAGRILEGNFRKIIDAADAAARRAADLRGGAGDALDAASKRKGPADASGALFGTAAGIAAINKARGFGPKDVQQKILDEHKKGNRKMDEVKRAIERQPRPQPANLGGGAIPIPPGGLGL